MQKQDKARSLMFIGRLLLSNGPFYWQVAQAQLQATGKGTLLRLPKVEQEVKTFPPDVQKLLNYRPTTGRTTRAMYGGDSGIMAKGDEDLLI